MKLLITGGAGFIGSNYVRMVLSGRIKGIKGVTVLDKLTYAGNLANLENIPHESLEFVKGDICDVEIVDYLVKKNDAIINFAAESHVDRSIFNSKDFMNSNFLGTHVLLESARKNKLNNFVQISTDEVYGSIDKGSWSESSPLMPNSPYAASKAAADLIVRAYTRTYGLNAKITRCCNNYGPRQHPEKLIPLFITNLLEGKELPLYGNGLNVREWLHVDDHCRAIHKVLIKGKSGEIYNVGGNYELSNFKLTEKVLIAMNENTSKIKKVKDRKGHDYRYSLDTSKISNEMQFKPKIDFDTGLLKTIEWYKHNRAWWEPLKK